MDPVTQGVVGAVLPQALQQKKKYFFWAGLLGWLGGMAPDLDSFIRSDHDPLLYLEYHRQFSHSIIFIPIGGFICALFFHILLTRRKNIPFKLTFLFCTLGYATHGLLDAATSYGTMLFWPFSDQRIDWRIISIIDPLFTLPTLILVIFAAIKGSARFAQLGLAWMVVYLCLGALQNHRASITGFDLASSRGHAPESIHAKPSFGNLYLWKIIYEYEGRFYVDAVRAGLTPDILVGQSITRLNIKKDLPWLDPDSQQAKDIERFRWFSKGYIAKDPTHDNRVIDLRYSFLPNQIKPLWFIELDPKADASNHVKFISNERAGKVERDQFLKMILGKDQASR
ncbi:MAG: metal-dependent hydrolase [Methylocystaceae bacterium]|nr:metal-dependent hydrolase [Methylocystaceae bacterium]